MLLVVKFFFLSGGGGGSVNFIANMSKYLCLAVLTACRG